MIALPRSLPELIDVVQAELDVRVEWVRLPRGFAGGYDHACRTIFLDRDLDARPRHAVATLAHEAVHAWRQDDGPQPEYVEARVDEIAAMFLVCDQEFALAEVMYGRNDHAIAVELGITVRLVRAFRRALFGINPGRRIA